MNETLQRELNFARPRAATPTERVRELVALLRGKGWMTRKELERYGFGERELRRLAQHDQEAELLSYPGSPGYRLFDEASLREIRRADALRSSARDQWRRWIRYQRRLHKRGLKLEVGA